MTLEILRNIADLRAKVAGWRAEGLSVGLVPTMGALHFGHITLARTALESCDRVIATVFVNPKQFGPNEDYGVYPREEDADAAKLEGAGVHVMFTPSVDEMYPTEAATSVSVSGLGDILEGAFRPGFFNGVATIVTKLLLQALPDRAYFGEKDYQQLQVIKRFVADLDIPAEIIGVPTVREKDGLAMSSRNAYLTEEERKAAPTLHDVLQDVSNRFKAGEGVDVLVSEATQTLLDAGFSKVDYIEIRNATTLAPIEPDGRDVRVLAAAKLGKARLIDNVG